MSNMECDRVKCVHNKMCNYLFELFNAQYTNVIDCNSYEEERSTGEWIPVSERLPDLYEVVLVTDETDKVFEYERRPLDEEGNVCEEWTFLGRRIIAWMPLPESYKEGDNE